jgi:hypothetical protein
MQYFVTEIMDSVELLQAHVTNIAERGGKVISVIWRDSDRVYVVTHGLEVEAAQNRRRKSS